MKKFVLLTIGFTKPTPEIMSAWMEWFSSIKDHIVEQVGLSNGREVTPENVSELPMDEAAITGYLVINAQGMDEAIKIAQGCPMITSTKVYEVPSH